MINHQRQAERGRWADESGRILDAHARPNDLKYPLAKMDSKTSTDYDFRLIAYETTGQCFSWSPDRRVSQECDADSYELHG